MDLSQLSSKLKHLMFLIDRQIKELEQYPDFLAFGTLIGLCDAVDDRYKDFCGDTDLDDGAPPGTAYGTTYGPNIEFYIEADLWHDISLELRKIKKIMGYQ